MIVLITGTTSGIGKLLAEHYLKDSNNKVIGINNKHYEILKANFKNYIIDISTHQEIYKLIEDLIKINEVPDIFFLNAGINYRDYTNYLDIEKFKDVLDVNLYGVLNFISAVTKYELHGKKIISISSTSNIVPNPSNIGYYISKISLKLVFSLLEIIDSGNMYKVIILGPVKTNIMRNYESPTGIKKILINILSIHSSIAVKKILKFSNNNKKILYYPISSTVFYILISFIIKLLPSFKKYL